MDEDIVVPYFMYNKSWYTQDSETGEIVLTDAGKKNEKAVRSYDEWKKDENYWKERGFDV